MKTFALALMALMAVVVHAEAQAPAAALSSAKTLAERLMHLGLPLPADLRIVPAESGAPAELVRMPRVVTGYWNDRFLSLLVIEKVHASGVDVVYAWGKHPFSGTPKGWKRFPMKYEDGELTATYQHLSLFFRAEGDRLMGSYRNTYPAYMLQSGYATGMFKKVTLPE